MICLGAPRIAYSPDRLLAFCREVGLAAPPPKAMDGKLTAEGFFRWLGFEEYLALDVSAYEGAQIVHDLNDPDPPVEHHGTADLIYDGGTLEHVFHLPHAFACIHRLLAVDGIVCHHNPSNGYLDHGFYQMCPTLYHDYYRTNGYSVVTAALVDRLFGMRVRAYDRDVYRVHGPLFGIGQMPRASTFFAARKMTGSTLGRVPTQGFYRQMHHGSSEAYDVEFRSAFEHVTPKEAALHATFEQAARQSTLGVGKAKRRGASRKTDASGTDSARDDREKTARKNGARPTAVRNASTRSSPRPAPGTAWQRFGRGIRKRLRAVRRLLHI